MFGGFHFNSRLKKCGSGQFVDCFSGSLDELVDVTLARTTSTEQCDLAATAADVLPIRNRSIRLPHAFAPTKIQSAPHFSASFGRTSFGFPAST